MNPRAILCAEYVLRLSQALAETRYAEDRPLYQTYLADVAVLLALLTQGHAAPDIEARIALHERLRGQTFPSGPEQAVVSDAWQRFLRPP
jgi:hypothetical protein